MRQVWQGAERLDRHPDYARLLGTPTLRERVVAWMRGWGERSERWHLSLGVPQMAMACLALIVICAGGWAWLRPAQGFETQIAEIDDISLSDGSVVTLGGHSALDVGYSPEERTVQLTRGEAFFEVTPDKNRPFVVEVGGQRIRVVGTKFNVNFDGERVVVSVKEGVVQVAPEGASGASAQAPVTLVAGQTLNAGSGLPARAEQYEGGDPGAWRTGRLHYSNASLGQIIADARRYYPHPIQIASPDLAEARLTTSFRTSQIDQMLETLSDSLPLAVDRKADGSVSLRPLDPARH